MTVPKTPLRILCFGDSLTAGYYGLGSAYHPYSEILQEKLESAFPNREVHVADNGMPGDVVTAGAFTPRLQDALKSTSRPFDWVIILGGTNDLAYGISPEEIFSSLEDSWLAALQTEETKVLALTVPECHAKSKSSDAKRNDLNERIMSYDMDRFYAFDLKAAIPYHSLTPERQKQYWDDGVHLTADGYDWLGGYVADALIKLMIQQVGSVGAKDRRSRRMLRYAKDELLFEEEAGDPNRIDEGYVIVRLKDLN